MASPTVNDAVTTAAATGTTLTLTLPSRSAGMLLVGIVSGDSDSAATMSGWTKPTNGYGSNGTQGDTVWLKVAAGDSSDAGVHTGASKTRFAHCYAIDAWSGTLADVQVATGTTNSINPPNLSMGSTGEYLFIAAIRNNNAITAAPTNYTNLITVNYLGAAYLGSARRALTASSEDPGSFTAGTASGAHGLTIGVKPLTAQSGDATLTAAAVLTAGGVRETPGSVTLAADATLAGAGVVVTDAAAALAASSTLTAAGVRSVPATASLVADSTLTATGSLAGTEATLTADSSLTASATAVIGASASLDADSTLTATAPATVGGDATLTADSAMAAAGTVVQAAAAAMSATTSLTATVGGATRAATALMAASANMAATAVAPTYAKLIFQDMEAVITPPGGYLEPLPLTRGPAWRPGDVRMVLVSAAASNNGAEMIQMTPNPPAGFTPAYSLNPDDETRGVYYRTLQEGDADTEVAWVKPPGWQYFCWSLLSVRGVNPAVAPVAGALAPSHTVGNAFCTVASVAVPAAGVMVFCLGTVPDPEGGWPSWATSIGVPTTPGVAPEDDWRHLTATDKSGDKFFPYDTNPAFAVMARKYTSSGTTGTVTFPLAQGAPATFGMWAFLRAAPDAISTGDPITADASVAAGSSATDTSPHSVGAPITSFASVGPAFNPLHGYIQQTYRLSGRPVEASRVSWEAVTPAGSSVTVESSLNNGLTWDVCQSWKPIPRLLAEDTTTRTVLVRATLVRESAAGAKPKVKLKVRIGCRVTTDELIPSFYGPVDKTRTKITAGSSGGSGGSSGGEGAFASGGGMFGGAATVKVHATDPSRLIKAAKWEQPFTGTTGETYTELGRAMVLSRRPSQALFSQVSSGHVLDNSLVLWDPSQGGDPWTDIGGVYTAIGHERLYDVAGAFVSRPVPDPRRGPVVWDFDHTVRPCMIGVESELDTTQIVNGWIIKGESTTSTNPVNAYASNLDTASRYNAYDPPIGIGKRFEHKTFPLAKTAAQCFDIATGALNNSLGLANTARIGIVPHPGIATGDILRISSPETGVVGRFLVQGYELPDSPVERMKLTCSRQTVNA